jgi:hypothetical protein
MNSFLTISKSLEYENIKPELNNILEKNIGNNITLPEHLFESMNKTCSNPGSFNYIDIKHNRNLLIPCEIIISGPEAVTGLLSNNTLILEEEKTEIESNYNSMLNTCLNQGSYSIQMGYINSTLSCDKLEEGKQIIIQEIEDDITLNLYNKEYSCGYWSCIKEGTPEVLISKQSQEYWKNKFYLFLIISLAITALLFIIIDNKTNLPIIIGILLVISTLPILKLYDLIIWLLGKEWLQFLGIFETLLNKSTSIFNLSLFFGVILILSGIGIKSSIICASKPTLQKG